MNVRKPILSAEEARQLHREALVIDYNPPAVFGFLFTESMRSALQEYANQGMTRGEAAELLGGMAAGEIQNSAQARKAYLGLWEKSGVTVASPTCGGSPPLGSAFEKAVKAIAEAQSIVGSLDGELVLIRNADDIEQAHQNGKRGIILNFQDTVPFGSELDRVGLFRDLGLRVVQLTYNLRNLVGDGCTEAYQSGLTYFGREMVLRLNELNMVVDVSHCSEQVGWDALEVSSAPIMVTHSSSSAVCYHDRAKSDELAKAVADNGGFFGVVLIPGFIKETTDVTLDDFARHVEHLVDVMGIDHVGIGTDKAGPGPGTSSLIEFPEEMPTGRPGHFDWGGFRPEHRRGNEYHLNGYEDFGDWPNLTVKLAERGFKEVELRKLLGLNYLRVFREAVGQ